MKVTWKKGMRLSTDVFNALDASIYDSVRLSNLIATGGRYGLIPVQKPFDISVNVTGNSLEVVALRCHGVTKSGKIVAIDFDSDYTHTFDTSVSIPGDGNESYLLILKLHDGEWREVDELYSEEAYSFELIGENSLIDDDSLPIARLINEYGWRLDETDFVPPCLYTDAHFKYGDLETRTKDILKSLQDQCINAQNCMARFLVQNIWSEANRAYFDIVCGEKQLSPAMLLTSLKKVVASFLTGCDVDEYITLENAEPFISYYNKSYDARNIYRDIKKGLELCSQIVIKMEAVCNMAEPAPRIEKPQPKPQPAPEPKASARRRWEGLEI